MRTRELYPLSFRLYPFLITSVRQHFLNTFLVAFGNHYVDVEVAFTLARFLGQNMSRVAVAAFEFAARRRAKTLCRAFVCFKFWHNNARLLSITTSKKSRSRPFGRLGQLPPSWPLAFRAPRSYGSFQPFPPLLFSRQLSPFSVKRS
jgi:hypothetical protein